MGGRGKGHTAMGDAIQGGDTPIKLYKIIFFWLNLERTPDKRCEKMGMVRRRQLTKVITFQRAMTKNVLFFCKKK